MRRSFLLVTFIYLDGGNKFPVQLPANLLPYLVLFDAFLTVFQHRKVLQKRRLFQEFAKFVNRIVVVQEVDPVRRAKLGVRSLDFHEQVAEFVLQVRQHDRRFDTEFVLNVRDVLVVLVVPELFQNLLDLFVRNALHVDAFLLDLGHDVVEDVFRYLRALLRLKLCENLPKVVDTFVGVEAHLLRRLLVRRLLVFRKVFVLFAAGGVVAENYPFVLNRNELALVAATADRRRLNVLHAFHKVRVGVALVGVDVGRNLVLRHELFEFEERVQYGHVLVHPFRNLFFFVEIPVNMFAVAQQIV